MKSNTFQIILYVVSGILIVIGFGSLAVYGFLQKEEQDLVSEEQTVRVLMWGTLDGSAMGSITNQLSGRSGKIYSAITYVEKNPATVLEEYKDAVVYNKAPDMLLLDHETIFNLKETLWTIPLTLFPSSQYQRVFIEAADIFKIEDGYLAIPFLSDALVLYYNKNLFDRNGIPEPPETWNELTTKQYTDIIAKYRKSDKTLIPMGAYGNYKNVIDLFIAIVLQVKESEGKITQEAIESIVNLYTKFADTRSSVYSWNIAFPNARDMFIGNRLIYYPGFISEYRDLRRANPNIVVRVASLPQFSDGPEVTPTKLYGFAIPKASRVPRAAQQLAVDMIGTFYRTNEKTGTLEIQKSSTMTKLFPLPPAIRHYYPDEETEDPHATFIETLATNRSIYLTPEEKNILRQTLRAVTVGSTTIEAGAETILTLFE